jgi:hypothetical protein
LVEKACPSAGALDPMANQTAPNARTACFIKMTLLPMRGDNRRMEGRHRFLSFPAGDSRDAGEPADVRGAASSTFC